MNGYTFPRYGGDIVKSYAQKAWASLRKGDAQQAKQQFDFLLREGIRKRFGQHFDEAHRSFLEEELYVIGARGAECLFLHYLHFPMFAAYRIRRWSATAWGSRRSIPS